MSTLTELKNALKTIFEKQGNNSESVAADMSTAIADYVDTAPAPTPGEGPSKEYEGPALLIPMYIYPAGGGAQADYARLISLSRSYPHAPIYAIVNPSNGPGDVVDGNYTDAIKKMRAAGINVLGYVSTDYPFTPGHGSVTLDAAKEKVDKWFSLYPVDGIFFDEMSYASPITAEIQGFYSDLLSYSHERGFYPVIANPGVAVPEDYFTVKTADVIVIHETSAWPTEAAISQWSYNTDVDKNSRAVLVYGSGVWDVSKFKMVTKYAGMLFCNDGDILPNPWDSLTATLETQLQMLGDATALNGFPGASYRDAGNLDSGTLLGARMPALSGDVVSMVGTTILTLVAAKVLEKFLTVDGPGSNTSADMLDDQHGDFYRDAGNLNAGTVPAGRFPAFTGDVTSLVGTVSLILSAAKVLEKLLTVDGAGSLVDSDFLDGEHGAFYRDAGNLNAGTILAGRFPAMTGDVTSIAGTVNLILAAAKVLEKFLEVDGPGSNTSADMLDDQHGAFYLDSSNQNAGTLPSARLPAFSGDVTSIIGTAVLTLVASAVMEKFKLVDGAGSGSDSDLWDALHRPLNFGESSIQYGNASIVSTLTAPASWGYFNGTPDGPDIAFPGFGGYYRVFYLGRDTDGFRHYMAKKGSGGGLAMGTYNEATLAMTWELIWTSRTDGAGSSSDSDTVDGIHASGFMNRRDLVVSDFNAIDGSILTLAGTYSFGTGFQPLNRPGLANYFNGFVFRYNLAASYATALVFGSNSGEIFGRQLSNGVWNAFYKIWNELNDGAGSLMDADMTDGLHAGQELVKAQTGAATAALGETYQRYTGAGGHTITLPAATGSGRKFIFKHAGTAGILTVSRAGTDTIDDGTSISLTLNASATLIDGVAGRWDLI